MVSKKIMAILGIVLSLLSASSIYYLYRIQTKAVPILEVKQSLGHSITPGTLITSELVDVKTVFSRDLPLDAVSQGSLGKVYADKYLYPGDPVVNSKVTSSMPSYLDANNEILSIKPNDAGLMGFLKPNDLITIIIPNLTINNVRVFGLTDDNGSITSVVPQFSNDSSNNSFLSVGPAGQQAKTSSHILIITSKQNAELIAANKSNTLSVIFEQRPSLEGNGER